MRRARKLQDRSHRINREQRKILNTRHQRLEITYGVLPLDIEYRLRFELARRQEVERIQLRKSGSSDNDVRRCAETVAQGGARRQLDNKHFARSRKRRAPHRKWHEHTSSDDMRECVGRGVVVDRDHLRRVRRNAGRRPIGRRQ